MDALVLNIEKLSNDPVPNKKMTWLRGTNRSQGKLQQVPPMKAQGSEELN